MKANQHEYCLIILLFGKTWLILYPFPASLEIQAVSQGPPCLLLCARAALQGCKPEPCTSLLLSYLPSLQSI